MVQIIITTEPRSKIGLLVGLTVCIFHYFRYNQFSNFMLCTKEIKESSWIDWCSNSWTSLFLVMFAICDWRLDFSELMVYVCVEQVNFKSNLRKLFRKKCCITLSFSLLGCKIHVCLKVFCQSTSQSVFNSLKIYVLIM